MSKSLVLFGGSFDPPHIGHDAIVCALFAGLNPDMLIIIPTGTPPHKAKSLFVPDSERMEMAQLAFGGMDKVLISDYEIQKREPCFTIDTVRWLKRQYSGYDITVAIGSDEANSFDSWKNPGDILALAQISVFHREGEKRNIDSRFLHLEGDIPAVSSTKLRALIARGEFDAAHEFITNDVYNYVLRSGLYVLRLSKKRLIHSRNVAETARRLAGIYGENEELAYKAGLYHDIAKENDFEKMLKNVEKWVLTTSESRDIIQNVEYWRDYPKVLHAYAGAEEVYDKYFHLLDHSDDALSAIRYHTSGRADMSLLEKIIFVADAVSAERRYDGVLAIRRQAFTDINKAAALILKRTLFLLSKYHLKIFPLTTEAYSYYKIYE